MKKFLVAYDLKNIKPGDNARAKEALLLLRGVRQQLRALDAYTLMPKWFKLPDTTLVVEASDTTSIEYVEGAIEETILNAGCLLGNLVVVEMGRYIITNRT